MVDPSWNTSQSLTAEKKIRAERGLEEIKAVLVWERDTRCLIISLPKNRMVEWSGLIDKSTKSKKSNHGELDTLVGRLNHIGFIIPHARRLVSLR